MGQGAGFFMFGIGLPEILLILGVALLVIGPDKLPEVARTLGKAFGEFKKVVDGLKISVHEDLSPKKTAKAEPPGGNISAGEEGRKKEGDEISSEGEDIKDKA